MRFLNLRHPEEAVDFPTAVRRGLGRDRGLFFPERIPALEDLDEDVDALLALPFRQRSARILALLTGLGESQLRRIIDRAFNFPIEQVAVADSVHALELFHGPSLAFKDFGARFLGGCLEAFSGGREGAGQPAGATTILTATSGDTGAAVAHAFHGKAGVSAVILYPRGRISPLQEKLFCTLGGNIHTIAVEADFDACQALVKEAFEDQALRRDLGLNSANSINVARLLAQVCYYFESVARLGGRAPVFCVPSGNFGNLTAGLIARTMGLPMRRMIAATNVNDTVPRYLAEGRWEPRETVATLSNAMDISRPNNFPRVEELARRAAVPIGAFFESRSVTDYDTLAAIRDLHDLGYLADPHSALAWRALTEGSDAAAPEASPPRVFLCTAHPAKFAEVVEEALGEAVALPPELAAVRDKEVLSSVIAPDFDALREELRRL